MILRTQPTDPWVPLDFSLLEALTIIESETCNGCGAYIWLCDWEGDDVMFEVKKRTCKGQKKIRTRQNRAIKDNKQRTEDAKGSSQWGEQLSTYPKLTPQSDREKLPTRREYLTMKQEQYG